MKKYKLFEGYGVELEYMIVNRESLAIAPVSNELLRAVLGTFGSDFENGVVTWSNELVMHVIELKSTRPEADLDMLENEFAENVSMINRLLERHDAMLLPTAAHPFMDPATDTHLWPHDSNEVYTIYNKIFDCRGHGWSNLQSTHVNLPFASEQDFGRLHAAIRVLLPLLPALCASSPILGGASTGHLDTRLIYYRDNQAKIPSITGKVIPEPLFTFREYKESVYDKIAADISAYNEDNILDPIWVNSRGAIPRFDRGSIEIRIMDIQECPAADLAIVTLVTETLKMLVDEKLMSFKEQAAMDTDGLLTIFNTTIRSAGKTAIDDERYLSSWGLKGKITAAQLWDHIVSRHVKNKNQNVINRGTQIKFILDNGTLGERMMRRLGASPSHDEIVDVFKELSECLTSNKMFSQK